MVEYLTHYAVMAGIVVVGVLAEIGWLWLAETISRRAR